LAKKFNLPVAKKKDSQGICFLGEVDLKEFLKHYIRPKRGKVLSEKGDVIGFHDGAVFYTLGERHGYTITKKNPNDGAYFVIGKDIKKNILVVSHNSKQMLSRASHSILNLPDRALVANAAESTSLNFVQIKDVNWISEIPDENKNYTAQIRYHGEFLPCKIEAEGPERSRRMIFKKRIVVASGQSCVVYDKGICLGGGIVV
jgi:tRNA-specific 2-thiouridylase